MKFEYDSNFLLFLFGIYDIQQLKCLAGSFIIIIQSETGDASLLFIQSGDNNNNNIKC